MERIEPDEIGACPLTAARARELCSIRLFPSSCSFPSLVKVRRLSNRREASPERKLSDSSVLSSSRLIYFLHLLCNAG